ncbi:MAG: phosphoadenosine phosphosulfate reductase family protein [Desulfurococcales archaeon]|nr:phosphoadenosine phosphosulfate reductase family protein [Desulfurococcales archaeon]
MRKWGIRTDIYWCRDLNVPSRNRECGGLERGVRLRLAEPADIRPAFDGDLAILRESLLNEFGSDALMHDLGIDEGSTYLNKAPHFDDMKEVIVGGSVVGRVYFDPKHMMWRWRLSSVSAEIAVSKSLVKAFRVGGPVRPLQVVGDASHLIDGTQAVVTDASGRLKALAVAKKGKFRVQSFLRVSEPPVKKKATFEDFMKVNDLLIRSAISRAVKHVAVMQGKTGLKPVVSFSGGKDSLVALHISLEAGLEPDILFNDTGLELPPTPPYVKAVANSTGLDLIVADAGDLFWKGVKVFGPPGKDFRWCCKVVKMSPIAKVYRTRYSEGALAIIGQRAYESVDRSWSGKVWRNRWLPSALNISPIQDWDQLTVWAYIRMEKLRPNPLYMQGFDRLGCFMCPAGNVAEYYMVMKHFPDTWGMWEEILEEWRKRLGMRKEWVRYHLWRWLNPRAQGRRRVEAWLGLRSEGDWRSEYGARAGINVEVLKKGRHISLRLTPPVSLDSLRSQWRVLSPYLKDEGGCVQLRGRAGEMRACEGEEGVVLSAGSVEDSIDLIRLMVRWDRCVGCGNCETWCPESAINVSSGKPVVDLSRCSGCRICLEVCPVAEMFTGKVIAPQIVGDPRGVRRSRVSVAVEMSRSKRRAAQEGSNPQPAYEGISEFLREGE